MSTGFGYVRDSKPNIINWADIGKQMSDAISADQADRQARKDDINKKEAEYAKSLLDQPQGSYEEANRFISDFSQQASQQALRDLQALKSGVISEQEYYQRRANLKSGTDLMFTAAKKFNENYDAAMQSIQNGESSVLLADLRAKMESYTNFAKTGAYINPLTASVNVSLRNEFGDISSEPGDFMTASELVRLSTEGFAKFKLDETVQGVVDSLGTLEFRDSNGVLRSINSLDPRDLNKFKGEIDGALDDEVNAIVGDVNSKVAASILADHSGKGYKLSFDINNTDPNKIVYDPQGNVVLTEDQLNEAKEIVRRKFMQSFDRKVQYPSPTKPTGTQIKASNELKANIRLGEFFRDALAAKDADALIENLESIQKFNKNIKNIRKVGKDSIQYQFINAQGELVNETISLSDDIKFSVEKGLQDLLGPKVNVTEITDAINFKGYDITETEGLYEPTLVKDIKTVQDPKNVIFTTTDQGKIQSLGSVTEIIDETAEDFSNNDTTGRSLELLFFHQGFEDFTYDLIEREVTKGGRGGQGGRGRRKERGVQITIPSVDFKQLDLSENINIDPNNSSSIFINSSSSNIDDIITEILSKATNQAINLEKNIKQDKKEEDKKSTPISPNK